MDVSKLSVKQLVSSDLPVSEVIGELSKRLANSEISKPEYQYTLIKIFTIEDTFDGLKDVNYEELQTTDASNPYSDTIIEDFNGETNKVIRETVEATEQSNVKTKILNNELMNFKSNPLDAIITAYDNTENINKAQQLFVEKLLWKTMLESTTLHQIDYTSNVPDISNDGSDNINKGIYNTLLDYQTTSKQHVGVGINGVLSDTKGNTINPSKRYDSNEFYLITNPKFETNTVFDGERSFFNWGGDQLEIAGKIVLNINKYEGMDQSEKDILVNMRAILIHKKALLTIRDWNGSGIANSGKLYSIIKNYLKVGVYKRQDKPVIIFNRLPETKSKQEDKK